jgi:hypothetical protein
VTVGIQISQAEINNQAGALARSVFNSLENVRQFKAWLDGLSAQDLATGYGFSVGDANVLKSAFTDLGDLAGIFQGSAAVATLPHDYRVFAKQLLGTGLF